ncbi:hypothetical protein Mthe_1628 [Methanothrix thermoacetophila PT]|uniref:Uncharacterized protein n=1 Tax=Methanothrix thermoacetophila (strain DSM 6194 / JCM 14653 / NBRC 101360 / PT) TaxID=349307 RepID=A0B9M1_METTP|nr:hypothetical protein Mthe_1628 [Methanothrix thermoacetophila PT]
MLGNFEATSSACPLYADLWDQDLLRRCTRSICSPSLQSVISCLDVFLISQELRFTDQIKHIESEMVAAQSVSLIELPVVLSAPT